MESERRDYCRFAPAPVLALHLASTFVGCLWGRYPLCGGRCREDTCGHLADACHYWCCWQTSMIVIVSANVIHFCPVFSFEVAVLGLSRDALTARPLLRGTTDGVMY